MHGDLIGDADALSELLRHAQLRGESVAHCAPVPPFAIDIPSGTRAVHIVETGQLELLFDATDAREAIVLGPGDLALVATGRAHRLRVGGGSVARRLRPDDLISGPLTDRPSRWVFGSFGFDERLGDTVLSTLPDVIVVRHDSERAAWLELGARLLVYELADRRPGSAVMVSRILDLLFVHALRDWAISDLARPGWLTAAVDPEIGRALAAVHSAPEREWSVQEMARTARSSRTTFTERFTALLGEPPATYLTGFRMDQAAMLLRTTSLSVMEVAAAVGYTSDSAFSRAFHRRLGMPPSRWRRTMDVGTLTEKAGASQVAATA